jgi:uncharacterized Zn finger protein (UPF0148 family)
MRTCPKCGCYIPDNWINCPACEARVAPVLTQKKTEYNPMRDATMEWNPWRDSTHYTEEKLYENSNLTVYRVDVLYDYERIKTREYFGQYENALKYAMRQADDGDVLAVQIITDGRIIGTVHKNS